MGPARMIVKSLTSRPGIREQNRPGGDISRGGECYAAVDTLIFLARSDRGKIAWSSERLTSTAVGGKASPSGVVNLKLWLPVPRPAHSRSLR